MRKTTTVQRCSLQFAPVCERLARQVVLNGTEPKPFTFDYAAGSSVTQLEMFELIGKHFADSCLAG